LGKTRAQEILDGAIGRLVVVEHRGHDVLARAILTLL
jgi:hypothetical protein